MSVTFSAAKLCDCQEPHEYNGNRIWHYLNEDGIAPKDDVYGYPYLNMANGNFARFVQFMDIQLDYCGIAEGDDLKVLKLKAEALRDMVKLMPELDAGRPDVVHETPGLATLVECGNEAGYYLMRVEQLLRIIAVAEKHGASVVWG